MLIKILLKYAYSSVVPFKYRRSKSFRKKLGFLLETRNWDENRMVAYHHMQLKKLLLQAGKTNYYEEQFKLLGITHNDILFSKNVTSLHSMLPIIDKKVIRSELNRFLILDNIKNMKCEMHSTSGSTGEPLKYMNSKECLEWEQAFYIRHLIYNRYQYGEKIIYLRSYVPVGNQPLIYYDPQWKIYWFSAYHMTDENMENYVKHITESKIKSIVGYPSSLYILAYYCFERGIKLAMDTVITASEALIEDQRKLIENVFVCNVGEYYGLSERVISFGKCQCGLGYHEYPEYGLFDIIDQRGRTLSKEGEIGELIGTNFTNMDCLPWIRYRTGDLAIVGSNGTCNCGINTKLKIKTIVGRTDDILFGEKRKKVPGVNIYSVFREYSLYIRNFKLYQQDYLTIIVSIVPTNVYSPKIEEKLRMALKSRFGNGINFVFTITDSIPRGANGKIKIIDRNKMLGGIL